jgi:hypothetical protein
MSRNYTESEWKQLPASERARDREGEWWRLSGGGCKRS